MKKQNILIGVAASTLLLSGCGFLNNSNNEQPKQSNTQSANQNDKSSKPNTQENESENNQTEQSNASQQNENKGYIYPKNTKEYYAQIMLTSFGDYDQLPLAEMKYTPVDMSGQAIFPYDPDASARYPDGVIRLRTTGIAHTIFKDNNDGTVTIYDGIPAHFTEEKWFDKNYSLQETQRILSSARTLPINTNLPKADIEYVASIITQDTPQSYNGPASSNTGTSNSASSSSSSPSSTKVTRSNVIDLVEDYEGHLLDTSTYTFKEPEQMPDGRWGFSILDKAGNLVGSYIIDTDGTVTKYDEKGQPV